MAHIVPSNASRWTTKSIVRDDDIGPEDVAELIAAMEHSCALDIADRGGITLEDVGVIMNLTRERIRQVEVRGLEKLKETGAEGTGLDVYLDWDPNDGWAP